MQDPILFKHSIAVQKPRSLQADPCPFCQPETLTNILAQDGDKIWLLNKYPVMEKTWQTVVVETAEHEADITTYTSAEWCDILHFGLQHWRETRASGKFRSVIYYRNFGPVSGGSIRHPHGQIIGCEEFDYLREVRPEHLTGEVLHRAPGVEVTFADRPICGLREFNVRLAREEALPEFAEAIRRLVCFLRSAQGLGFGSYNIFFYAAGDAEYCKIIPRGITSPLFLGYGLTQIPDEEAREKLLAAVRALW